MENGKFTEDISQISFDEIPTLDRSSAEYLGDRQMGTLSDMVSQFEVADDYTQINYLGRPVRVTPLLYGDMFKWLNNRSDGLPAYLRIDMITQEVEVVRLSDLGEGGIKYSESEPFSATSTARCAFSIPPTSSGRSALRLTKTASPTGWPLAWSSASASSEGRMWKVPCCSTPSRCWAIFLMTST